MTDEQSFAPDPNAVACEHCDCEYWDGPLSAATAGYVGLMRDDDSVRGSAGDVGHWWAWIGKCPQCVKENLE
jgi:hypothetical protein